MSRAPWLPASSLILLLPVLWSAGAKTLLPCELAIDEIISSIHATNFQSRLVEMVSWPNRSSSQTTEAEIHSTIKTLLDLGSTPEVAASRRIDAYHHVGFLQLKLALAYSTLLENGADNEVINAREQWRENSENSLTNLMFARKLLEDLKTGQIKGSAREMGWASDDQNQQSLAYLLSVAYEQIWTFTGDQSLKASENGRR